jgi:hypothetical protein
MDNNIVQHNANLLWNHGHRRLDVDGQGKLSVISDWDIGGRIRKFFRNWNGAVTQKINTAVAQTLDSIEKARIEKVWDDRPKSLWFRLNIYLGASYGGEEDYPLRYLAHRIDNIAKFKHIPGIKAKTDYLGILDDRYECEKLLKYHLKKQKAKANGEDLSGKEKFSHYGFFGHKPRIGCSDWD